jgi:predicted lipoprotein with Yx(FWY)xxD motif
MKDATMKLRYVPILALSFAAAVTSVVHAEPVAKMVDGVLANGSGMTLYIFDKDVAGSGKSSCSGPCTALWPAFSAAADAKPEGDFTVITRDDGNKQWAYKGNPLYTYAADKKAGDKAGDNFKDVWHVVK